jgi:hypothetical protein
LIEVDGAVRNKFCARAITSVKMGQAASERCDPQYISFYSIFKSIYFATLKASNIFELFSIFVAGFFPRNVSRADWMSRDGAWAGFGGSLPASFIPLRSAALDTSLPARIGHTVLAWPLTDRSVTSLDFVAARARA